MKLANANWSSGSYAASRPRSSGLAAEEIDELARVKSVVHCCNVVGSRADYLIAPQLQWESEVNPQLALGHVT